MNGFRIFKNKEQVNEFEFIECISTLDILKLVIKSTSNKTFLPDMTHILRNVISWIYNLNPMKT